LSAYHFLDTTLERIITTFSVITAAFDENVVHAPKAKFHGLFKTKFPNFKKWWTDAVLALKSSITKMP